MSPLPFSGSNINSLKAHNLQTILMTFLHEKSLSRAGIAKRTSLSSATVTNLIKELIDQGLITEEESEPEEASGKRRVGRPRTMLRLAPQARYAIGVHIGVGLFRVALTDLYAEIIDNRIVEYDPKSPASQILDLISAEIKGLIADNHVDQDKILGIGVGASGLVNHQTGVNVMAPRLGWKEVNIQDVLEVETGHPVRVDNNVRAMAVGEAFFGAGRDVNVMAFVYGRIGVGAGLVVNGQVYRGERASAGEIGHTVMIPEGGDLCECGNRGCLETLISEPVLIKNSKKLAEQHPKSILAQHLDQENGREPIEKIFAAAREGDELTQKMIAEQIRYLGLALANLVNILNPEMILLGGMFAQGEDLILPIAQKVMQETAFCGIGDKVDLRPTTFGWRAGVIGAASIALSDFFYQTES
jgi:glucokinase-like ROK family protein